MRSYSQICADKLIRKIQNLTFQSDNFVRNLVTNIIPMLGILDEWKTPKESFVVKAENRQIQPIL